MTPRRPIVPAPHLLVPWVLVSIGLTAPWAAAQTPDPLEEAGYDLEERMATFRVPGASVAVFDGGEVVWARGYGVVEVGGDQPVTPDTRFQAASISKPVTAVGVLRLVESGSLDLDRDVNDLLRSWTLPQSDLAGGETVTLRRILSHRAGLNVHGFPGYARGAELPSLPQILDGEEPANTDPVRVTLPPGAGERYSGGGTTVAELVLEDVTGIPFPDLMDELVLGPAGMEGSTFEQPLPRQWERYAARAHDWNGAPLEGGWHAYPERAAAGLWTTPTDLARLALQVQAAFDGSGEALLTAGSAREMLTPRGGSFGLGFMVEGEGDGAVFHHGGANRGFRALLVAYREGGRGVVVMTNGDNGDPIAAEVARVVARSRGWTQAGR